MQQRPPGAVPPEIYCVVGQVSKSVLGFEEHLLRQHEIGAVRVFDRGHTELDGPDLIAHRWRMSWLRDGEPVHAVLMVADLTDTDHATAWLGAYCDAGWGWGIKPPTFRLGLNDRPIVDPLTLFDTTNFANFAGGQPLGTLREALQERRTHVPIVAVHQPNDPAHRDVLDMQRCRQATCGAVAMLTMDDAVAEVAAANLPEQDRIPHHGARLFLPPWCAGHHEDVVLSAEERRDERNWRRLTEIALAGSRWREEGPLSISERGWGGIFLAEWHDERLLRQPARGPDPWAELVDGGEKSALRQHIASLSANEPELRELRARRRERADEVRRAIERQRVELAELTESRRRLARGVQRLRGQRDAVDARLARTSVGAALRARGAAQRLAAAREEELRHREDELDRLRRREAWSRAEAGPAAAPAAPSAARRWPHLEFGPAVVDLAELSERVRRRCERVLGLLDECAAAPDATDAADFLLSGGISPALLDRVPPGPVVTFPLPDGEWCCFADRVLVERAEEHPAAIYYRTGAANTIHIGFIGSVPA